MRRSYFFRPRWVALFALGAVLVVVWGSLRYLARAQTRKLLGELRGASGQFSSVELSIFPLRYSLTRLKIHEHNSETKEPAFYADELAVNLHWGSLLTGRLRGTVEGRGVKVVLHQPPEGSHPHLPPIEKLVPFRAELERAQLKDGEVLYIWVREKDRPSMWFHSIEATLENVGSRPHLNKGPMVLSARGKVQRQGKMMVFVTADPYATPLNFAGTAKISDFDLSGMNALLASTQDVKLTPGRFAMDFSFECDNGRLRGWIDPRVSDTEITAAHQDLGNKLKALLRKVSLAVAPLTEGTDSEGRIRVSDDLSDPRRQLWPTLEKVVENALLLGVQEALKRKAGPVPKQPDTSKKKPTKLKTSQ